MEETNNKASGKIVTALIIGLVVGFALGVFWEKRRSAVSDTVAAVKEESDAGAAKNTIEKSEEGKKSAAATADISTTTLAAAAAAAGSATVSAANQPAGNSVIVSAVSAKAPVWIAVREMTNGAVGNILGAQKVLGEGKDVLVELLRPTKPNAKYIVVLYADVGSPAFNYREDVLLRGVEGTFETTEK